MNAKTKYIALAGVILLGGITASAADIMDLTFARTGVKRFIFSNNLPLSEMNPSEIIGLRLMHPVESLPDSETPPCDYSIDKGSLAEQPRTQNPEHWTPTSCVNVSPS